MTDGKPPSATIEFPPLLAMGMQAVTEDQLAELCVDAFPLSKTRPVIMARLREIASRLRDDGIVGELWVDGSFVTEKIDPEDADVVLKIQAHLYDNGTPLQKTTVEWLIDGLKETHSCDTYVVMEYPVGHQLYWEWEYMRAYWIRQWGFSRGDDFKGIAVITIP